MTALQRLHLRANPLLELDGAAPLMAALPASLDLLELSDNCCSFTPSPLVVAALARRLAALKHLTELRLNDCRLEDCDGRLLAALPASLERLFIVRCCCDDAAAAEFASRMPALGALSVLWLDDGDLCNHTAVLAALPVSLRSVHLTYPREFALHNIYSSEWTEMLLSRVPALVNLQRMHVQMLDPRSAEFIALGKALPSGCTLSARAGW